MAYRVRRYFTPREATALVPYLKAAFERIAASRQEIGDLYQTLESAGIDPSQQDVDPDDVPVEHRRAAVRLRRCMADVNQEVERIHDLGVLVKDLDIGLVDFAARHDDRDVFLCWRVGEEAVTWWHAVDAGFRARQSIADEKAFGAPGIS
jgi:hypothetical protein